MIRVLDHGYVELLDVMGDDREPARAARVSYSDRIERTEAQDMKLTRYLLKHGHMSPFEMVEVKFRIKAPIFVARQLVRHRAANWNEFSMRYAEPSRISAGESIDYYTPTMFRVQDAENKQASDGAVENQRGAHQEYTHSIEVAIKLYKELLYRGVAREQARGILPEAVYTEWVWKCDLRNTWNLLSQRDHKGAQWETREYAKAMISLLSERLPLLMGIWEERRANSR